MSHSMVYYCYSGSRPKLQEWKKYYDCSKLCLSLDPQTIFLKFCSTDQSPKNLWIHFYEHGGLTEGERDNPKSSDYSISGPCTHRMELRQLLYCYLFSTLPPSCQELWSQLWEFCSRKTQGMNLSNPQAPVCWPPITRTLTQRTPCRNRCTLRAAIPQHKVKCSWENKTVEWSLKLTACINSSYN